MNLSLALWTLFGVVVIALIALDLMAFRRRHSENLKSAALWTTVWVGVALLFNVVVWIAKGRVSALEFLTGYIVEWSLSMDNLFVFAVIFSYFSVPARAQHRALLWGIWGAIIMRLVFVIAGVALISTFGWMMYVFGAFLVFTGIKLALSKGDRIDPEKNKILRLAKRLLPVTAEYHGEHFVIRQGKKLVFTPLFLVLLVIETTDVVFAVDSVPAIFAITQDPFIIYTSNIFAILGLRAFYFLLSGFLGKFCYLNIGLAVVLTFVGVKMLVVNWFHVPIGLSLGFIVVVLGSSIVASLLYPSAEVKDEKAVSP